MKIREERGVLPGEDLYSLRFAFEDFTDEEKFLYNKYGFISVIIPPVLIDWGGSREQQTTATRFSLSSFGSCRFLFLNKESLDQFKTTVIDQIKSNNEKYLKDLVEFAGEDLYEVTIGGEIRKINEGAKRALDKSSPEYKEIIEKNREVFERLSKL